MSANLPTPIPLGGSHVVTPPAFDRWGIGARAAGRIDQRDYSRRPMALDIWLIEPAGRSVLRCRTNNISDAGVHASAPVGFGLAVGQRFEVRVRSATEPVSDRTRLAENRSLGYGTVIRTEIQVGQDPSNQVSFALRFDVPQLLPLR